MPHPVPARRAEGKSKTRLEPNLVTGPVVTAIFTWRVTENIGYQGIVDRLNADLDRYPAPISPDPARVRPDWTRSSIVSLLSNPKYTGYMVWNRRATKKRGQVNPPEQWVWSPEPTHGPLVTREMFQAAQTAPTRPGSSAANIPNAHPAARRAYLLRSYVFCSCGLRMFGKSQKGVAYYACQPRTNRSKTASEHHPQNTKTTRVREDLLLEGLEDLLNQRLFGADRRGYLEATLRTAAHGSDEQARAHRESLEHAIEQLTIRQDRLLTTLETQDDPDGTLFARIRDRLAALERDRANKITELKELTATAEPVNDPALLEQLPELHLNLAELPFDLQRDLFDALQLRIDYDQHTRVAHGRITLTEFATGAVSGLVRPELATVADMRAARTTHATARPVNGATGLPRAVRVESEWPAARP